MKFSFQVYPFILKPPRQTAIYFFCFLHGDGRGQSGSVSCQRQSGKSGGAAGASFLSYLCFIPKQQKSHSGKYGAVNGRLCLLPSAPVRQQQTKQKSLCVFRKRKAENKVSVRMVHALKTGRYLFPARPEPPKSSIFI